MSQFERIVYFCSELIILYVLVVLRLAWLLLVVLRCLVQVSDVKYIYS